MEHFTTEELREAKRSIASTKSKCEKALEKLTPGKSQHTLTARRIKAFEISLALIEEALSAADTTSDAAPTKQSFPQIQRSDRDDAYGKT